MPEKPHTPPGHDDEREIYVSYAWGDDSPEGIKREEIVNLMCQALREVGYTVGRDKDLIRPGDSIEDFADRIAKATHVIAVISEKYLHSKFCMVDEIYSAYQRCGFRRKEFQAKIIALVLDDGQVCLKKDTSIAAHWKKVHAEEEAELLTVDPKKKSHERWAETHKLEDMCGHLLNMLSALKDIVMPQGFEKISANGFTEVIGRLPAARSSQGSGAGGIIGITRPPHQLPPAAAEFFGRNKELKQLSDLLAAGKNACVLGPAGMGKTALAAHALARMIGEHAPNELCKELFPEGVIYIDLYALHAQKEGFWTALANSLVGAEFQQNSSPEERATMACRGRDLLLIIEGAEEASGKGDQDSLGTLLRVCPNIRRLILTRDSSQFMAGATVKVQDRLEAPHDGELFDRLGGKDIPPDVREALLKLLEGHPLALTWASSLLGRDDEHPHYLAKEWSEEGLPPLQDPNPEKAAHTLEWLFRRSERALAVEESRLLEAAGLLARSPISCDLLDGLPTVTDTRMGLRRLVQLGLLRRSTEEDHYEFTHVLGYRFARKLHGSDLHVRSHLGNTLRNKIQNCLDGAGDIGDSLPIHEILQHAQALLQVDATDPCRLLWRSLAKRLLYGFEEKLDRMGRLELRRMCIVGAQAWLESLPETLRNKPEWQGELSAVYQRLGDVARWQGDLDTARHRFTQAVDICERLVRADASNAGWQQNLAIGYEMLGGVARSSGDLNMAVRQYGKTLEIREKLVKNDPEDCIWQQNLSISYIHSGDLARDRGYLEVAKHHYHQALEIIEGLWQSASEKPIWDRDLSICYEKLGGVARAQGEPDVEAEFYTKVLAIREKMAEVDPGGADMQRNLVVSHDLLGNLASERGDIEAATNHHSMALSIAERLAEADSGNTSWQRDISVSNHKLGDMAIERGDFEEASCYYIKAMEITKKLAQTDPGNFIWLRDVSIGHYKLGNVAACRREHSSAERNYEQAIGIAETLVQVDPENTVWQLDLSASYSKMALLAEKRNARKSALIYFLKAHDILIGLHTRKMHLSPRDLDALQSLKDKISMSAPGTS